MSQRQPFLDRYSDQDEILGEILTSINALVNQGGVADINDPAESKAVLTEYAAFPEDGGKLQLPQGKLTFDFNEGTITHSAPDNSSYPDAGVLEAVTLPTANKIFAGLNTETVGQFRSLVISADTTVTVQLNPGSGPGGTMTIDPSQITALQSSGFTKFQITAKYPFEMWGAVTTHSQSNWASQVNAVMARRGRFPNATWDDWAGVGMFPHNLHDRLVGTGYSFPDYRDPPIEVGPYGRTSIRVKNTSPVANAIDAKVQAADTTYWFDEDDDTAWFDIGDSISEATGGYLAKGESYLFDVEQRHQFLRLMVTNETPGDSVAANAFVFSGGN